MTSGDVKISVFYVQRSTTHPFDAPTTIGDVRKTPQEGAGVKFEQEWEIDPDPNSIILFSNKHGTDAFRDDATLLATLCNEPTDRLYAIVPLRQLHSPVNPINAAITPQTLTTPAQERSRELIKLALTMMPTKENQVLMPTEQREEYNKFSGALEVLRAKDEALMTELDRQEEEARANRDNTRRLIENLMREFGVGQHRVDVQAQAPCVLNDL